MTSQIFRPCSRQTEHELADDINLPVEWNRQPLGACVDVLDSRRKPVNSKERASRVGPIPYYGATGQVGWIDDFLFDEELVLLGEDGAPFFDKSKPIAYIVDGKSWVNNHAHVLRARSEVTSNRFLKYYLDSFDFSSYVQGSTRDKLTQGAMNSIPVSLPPRHLQDELVALLDAVEVKRTSAGSHLAVSLRGIERFRQAVLAAACSGGLTADWRQANPGGETADEIVARIGLDRRRRLGKKFRDQPPAEIETEVPEGWCWVALGSLVDVATGATPLRSRLDYYGGDIPWVTSGAVNVSPITEATEYITLRALEETNTKLFPAGTLLVAMYGEGQTRGRVAELGIEAATNQAVAALLFHGQEELLRPYLTLFLLENYERIRALSFGGVQPNLSLGVIRATAVPLPPPDEQREIVERVNRLIALADALTQKIEAAADRVECSSQAVLAKAFRGDLSINLVSE
jgi:type I restriction enzyme S subunit